MLSPRRAAFVIGGVIVGGVAVFVGLAVWALPGAYAGRALPGVSVHGLPVGGKSAAEVRDALARMGADDGPRLRFARDGLVVLEPAVRDIGATLDVDRTASAALAAGRGTGGRALAARFVLLIRGSDVPLSWQLDREALLTTLRQSFASTLRPAKEPSWALEAGGAFVFEPGAPGTDLAEEEILAGVADRLVRGSREPVPLTFVTAPPATADADARVAGAAASQVTARPLALVTDDAEVSVPAAVREGWVRVAVSEGAGDSATAEPELDRGAIERYLRSSVTQKVARPARDAEFAVSGNRSTFVPASEGRDLLVAESATGILRGLAAGAERIKLVTKPVPSKVSVTPLMAEYGIRALLARGESDFAGSPRNRRHNIRVGAERYHGVLVPPGAEFSFNDTLGPVDAANGFLPELVILSNVTTPQYGGGLCQVSTTMFRAAIRAGLPITARRNHAYAVSYYGTPGFDATIYPPNPDLRFTNDTPGHLLVRRSLEGTQLAFEFWGTPDGRQVEVLGPFPYDRKPDGAVKATLVRKIARGGETQRDEWHSSYKSPKLFPKVLAANAETETWEQRIARIAEKDRKAQEGFERRKVELERRQETEERTHQGKTRPTPLDAARGKPTPEAEPE